MYSKKFIPKFINFINMHISTRNALFFTVFIYIILGFAIISPWISEIIGNDLFAFLGTVISIFCFLVFFSAASILDSNWKGLFGKNNDKKAETWLMFHSLFTNVSAFYYPLLMFFTPFVFIFLGVANFSTNLFLMALFGVLSWSAIWFLQKILGMNYIWLGKGKLLAIESYAELAHRQLSFNKKEGILNLYRSVSLLKDLLSFDYLFLEDLDKSMVLLTCFMNFKCEIPYEKMVTLSQKIKNFQSLKNVKLSLSTFVGTEENKWIDDITLKETNNKPISTKLMKFMTLIAATFSGLTFIPENNRQELITSLQSFNSPTTFQLLSGAILIVVIFYFSTIMEPYRLSFFELRRTDFSAK